MTQQVSAKPMGRLFRRGAITVAPAPQAQACSGLMYPDTDLGENARHGEVFDEQAKTYVFP